MHLKNTSTEWYHISNVQELDSPALVIYPDRVRGNIRLLKEMVGDVDRLRPHAKTHKSKEAAGLLLEAGIRKFKCATIAEAELLAEAGAADVLLAYQPVGPKIERLVRLIQRHPGVRFSCLVDDATAARSLSEAAAAQRLQIPVYLDLNVGMNRTGIRPEKALELYQICAQLPGIRPVGLHAYDGHITDPDPERRRAACEAAFQPVAVLKAELVQQGYDAPVIIAGGSPTFPIHARRADVECSPGTFIYWDGGYARTLADQPFQPAALVVTRIISQPDERTWCADLGHKSVASENSLDKRVYFLNAPDLRVTGHSEEHLVVQADRAGPYRVGDVLYGLPHHICPTIALYDRAYVVEEGRVSGSEWQMAARARFIHI